jgi:hypothetical protein
MQSAFALGSPFDSLLQRPSATPLMSELCKGAHTARAARSRSRSRSYPRIVIIANIGATLGI